tara:strand:+ start:41110 stop:42429 length:1320 start_codon:yes stop_codon:yes gene_type:complete
MSQLFIPVEQLPLHTELIKNLDKKLRDYAVTAVISLKNQSVTWIGGNIHNLNLITCKLEKGHGLKNATFAIPGDFYIQAVKSVISTQKRNVSFPSTELIFMLEYKKGTYARLTHKAPIRVVNPLNPSYTPLRKCETLSPVKEHLEYLQANTQRKYHRLSQSDIYQICYLNETLHQFDYVQLNADTREIRVQRAGKLEISPLPNNIHLPTTLILNRAILDEIKKSLYKTDVKEVLFALEEESITISTPGKTTTQSIAGLSEFISRIPDKDTKEVTLIVDNICLDAEIAALRNYLKQRKKNEGFIFIHNNELMVLNEIKKPDVIAGLDLSRQIFVKHISSKEAHLYRFHPQDLIDVKSADERNMKQVKLCITKNSKNERFMEFYHSTNDALPYTKIPVESGQSEIEIALLMKQDYLAITKHKSHSYQPEQKQLDLVSFDDI